LNLKNNNNNNSDNKAINTTNPKLSIGFFQGILNLRVIFLFFYQFQRSQSHYYSLYTVSNLFNLNNFRRFLLIVNKKTRGYLLDMRTNYFSIFFIYSNPFSSIKDSTYPHFKHTDALTCEKFRSIEPAESGLKTTVGIPPVLIIFPLLIRLLPHFWHVIITMIINNQQQKFCYNTFGG